MNNYFCAPKEIWQRDDKTLSILWTDNLEQEFDVIKLRQQCPCATCQETKKTESSHDTIQPKKIDSVGSYALKIEFSDGHKTGIYTFNYLRSLRQ